MINREITDKLINISKKFPVVFLTGPRQSGKSTLLKFVFKDYSYTNLENPSIREFAINDPVGFLDSIGTNCIIDEAQYVPHLFSYIQERVDRTENSQKTGLYILSGSQNFLLMESISQSLAGRVGILTLLPLSLNELEIYNKNSNMQSVDIIMHAGFYPRIYSMNIDPIDFYPNYIETYIERDVRMLVNIKDLSQFVIFIKALASRVGSPLDLTDISNSIGVTTKTIKSWISILETSYVIFLLKPYYNNYNKRLTKSPKIYFYDTGLVASLLNINSNDQLLNNPIYGHLFENLIIADKLKNYYNKGLRPDFYFWRDSNGAEVDLIIENANAVELFEIKSSKTPNPNFAKTLLSLDSLIEKQTISKVIYGGTETIIYKNIQFTPWNHDK
jgi:predicted AAA+ superfamily ATPase